MVIDKKTLSAKCLNYVINKTKQKDVTGVISKRPQDQVSMKSATGCTAGKTNGQTHPKQGARENKPVGKIQPKVLIIY